MAQQQLSQSDVLKMLEEHRLGTKKNGFEKFPSAIYSSREKVMSLLVMYAGMGAADQIKAKGPQLMEELLFRYKNLVKRFEEGYGLYNNSGSLSPSSQYCNIMYTSAHIEGMELDCARNLLFASAGAQEKDRITGEKIWKKYKVFFS